MLFGGFLRDQQDEDQVYGLAIKGVKIDLAVELQQGANGLMAVFKTTVRNGDTVAKAG